MVWWLGCWLLPFIFVRVGYRLLINVFWGMVVLLRIFGLTHWPKLSSVRCIQYEHLRVYHKHELLEAWLEWQCWSYQRQLVHIPACFRLSWRHDQILHFGLYLVIRIQNIVDTWLRQNLQQGFYQFPLG